MPVAKRSKNETKGQIADRVLENILDKYNFDASWHLLPIISLNGSLVVLNAKSEVTRKAVISSHGKQYILKEVPWYCAQKDFVEFMLTFHQQLYTKEFPLPQLVMTSANDLFTEVDGNFFYLQRFMHGQHFSGRVEEIRQAGQNLGHLHNLSRRIRDESGDATFVRFRETSFSLARSMLNILGELVNDSQDHLQEDEIEIIRDYCTQGYLFTKLAEQECESIYNRYLIQVHGDYNPLNIMYSNDGDRIIATFDLENTALDNPAHDVAEGLLDFCFHIYKKHSTSFAAVPISLNRLSARVFLQSYLSVHQEYFEELQQILPLVVANTFIELFTLGVIRGDYDFSLMKKALELREPLIQQVQEAIRT